MGALKVSRGPKIMPIYFEFERGKGGGERGFNFNLLLVMKYYGYAPGNLKNQRDSCLTNSLMGRGVKKNGKFVIFILFNFISRIILMM